MFLDIEKAYDMVCRDALLLKLLQLGISDSIGVEVVYLWVPAHCGIKGNEIADTLARIATGRMESHHLDPSTITRSEANLEPRAQPGGGG